MEEFFDTIYLWTSGFYGQELDNYMYDTVPGYLHVGLIMAGLSLLICWIFYYVLKPVRRQYLIWGVCVGVNALLNFVVALCYTNTPRINNEIDDAECWTLLDTLGFGVTNILWSVVAMLLFALIIKWWSPAKFIPYKYF